MEIRPTFSGLAAGRRDYLAQARIRRAQGGEVLCGARVGVEFDGDNGVKLGTSADEQR